MSAMGVMETNRFHRIKPAHRRKDSGEIDVFEASRYFSGGPETRTYTHNSSQRPMKEDARSAVWGGRKSLDISFKNSSFTSHSSYMVNDKHMIQAEKKKKKSKLPSSPGGKLASFLNSLFSQASSKKKSKSCSQSVKDDQDHETSPGGRRRRSSISHFHGFGSNRPSKSLYSSSSSGFRTPPPISQPSNIEAYNKARTMASLLESTKAAASTKEQRDQYYRDHDRDKGGHHAKILEKKVIEREGDRTVSSQKSFRRAYDQKVEDGGDSDSSSDLFDLPNYALGSVYSNGLPVYETTHLQDINRSRAIS